MILLYVQSVSTICILWAVKSVIALKYADIIANKWFTESSA